MERTVSSERMVASRGIARQESSSSSKELMAENPSRHAENALHILADSGSMKSKPGRAMGGEPKRKKRDEGVSFRCSSCRSESDRWQRGRWKAEDWDGEQRSSKGKVCKCVAGATADCAAVCCCPLSLLHLLALACIKLPSVLVIRALRKLKTKIRKKRKRPDNPEEDDGNRTPPTSYRQSREGEPWSPLTGFADHSLLREYFDARTTGFGAMDPSFPSETHSAKSPASAVGGSGLGHRAALCRLSRTCILCIDGVLLSPFYLRTLIGRGVLPLRDLQEQASSRYHNGNHHLFDLLIVISEEVTPFQIGVVFEGPTVLSMFSFNHF